MSCERERVNWERRERLFSSASVIGIGKWQERAAGLLKKFGRCEKNFVTCCEFSLKRKFGFQRNTLLVLVKKLSKKLFFHPGWQKKGLPDFDAVPHNHPGVKKCPSGWQTRLLPSLLMNMAVPVSFFQRDLALGSGRLRTGLAASAGTADWFSLAAAAAASTTAAKLVVPVLIDGAGTAKLFIVEAGGRDQLQSCWLIYSWHIDSLMKKLSKKALLGIASRLLRMLLLTVHPVFR